MHGLDFLERSKSAQRLSSNKNDGINEIFILRYWQNLVKMEHFLGQAALLESS
jgi:hypothetical protein